MKTNYYQVDWENGNTDVFTDRSDAERDYDPIRDDSDQETYDYAMEFGYYTDNPTPEMLGAIWSESAVATL